jgi:hypothetical protein
MLSERFISFKNYTSIPIYSQRYVFLGIMKIILNNKNRTKMKAKTFKYIKPFDVIKSSHLLIRFYS